MAKRRKNSKKSKINKKNLTKILEIALEDTQAEIQQEVITAQINNNNSTDSTRILQGDLLEAELLNNNTIVEEILKGNLFKNESFKTENTGTEKSEQNIQEPQTSVKILKSQKIPSQSESITITQNLTMNESSDQKESANKVNQVTNKQPLVFKQATNVKYSTPSGEKVPHYNLSVRVNNSLYLIGLLANNVSNKTATLIPLRILK